MLRLDDARWSAYRTGYNRVPFDLRPFLNALLSGSVAESQWTVLWDELHHQGDVGELSYATVPYLVAYAERARPIVWHAFGFPAVVEIARLDNPKNPPVPDELQPAYSESFSRLADIALRRGEGSWDPLCFEPVMACIALAYNRPKHAELYLDATEHEIAEFFRGYYGESDA